jgi:hypothetical protein
MIDTEQMQHRGVQIVRMHWLFHCRQTEFIRGSVCDPPFESAAGEQRRKAANIVVTALVDAELTRALDHRRTAEFTGNNQDGLIEKPSRPKIAHQ